MRSKSAEPCSFDRQHWRKGFEKENSRATVDFASRWRRRFKLDGVCWTSINIWKLGLQSLCWCKLIKSLEEVLVDSYKDVLNGQALFIENGFPGLVSPTYSHYLFWISMRLCYTWIQETLVLWYILNYSGRSNNLSICKTCATFQCKDIYWLKKPCKEKHCCATPVQCHSHKLQSIL